MKNIIERGVFRHPIILYVQTHIHKHHKKKPTVRVPVYKSEWIENKPGKNSWLARRG